MFRILLACLIIAVPLGHAVPAPSVARGIDVHGALDLAGTPEAPTYGTLWVGPWNLKHGWDVPLQQIRSLQDAGITPMLHVYYWGDDISRSCVLYGCWSSLHGIQKDQAGWDRLLDEVATRVVGEVVLLIETEFNKADVQRWDAFDTMIAMRMDLLHERMPEARLVLPLGNWNRDAWETWDEAAHASDAIGIQAMRAATRDDDARYTNVVGDTLDAAKHLAMFDRPVILHDVALSSYGGKDALQAATLERLTDPATLLAAGISVVVYRSWRDVPMDTNNYYGVAEHHWGLADIDGQPKLAADAWIDRDMDWPWAFVPRFFAGSAWR